ncbi:hypothetical protein D1007_15193 [Hordeum vulgare]|nr:hypothetical protein D1007_15193 [Hordeum vulgare]
MKTKITETFENILAKEDACVKEEKKGERFNILMAVIENKINLKEKKIKLEEKMVELTSTSEDTKILTMRMDESDPDVVMIVHVVHYVEELESRDGGGREEGGW